MKFDPDIHRRRSTRLDGYDYSQAGAYFITICTQDRETLFGEVREGNVELSDAGRIVVEEWIRSFEIRGEIELDEWVVMPNHMHAIVVMNSPDPSVGSPRRGDRPVAPTMMPRGPVPRSIGSLIAGFKSAVTKRINRMRGTPGARVWQRNYYDHVIRDEADLDAVRTYILENLLKWAEDENHPARIRE